MTRSSVGVIHLTPSISWSMKYAAGFSDPRIIEYHFVPNELIRNGFSFKYFGELNDEFADFVFSNRMFFMDSPLFCFHNYDFVIGVMSDGNQPLDFEKYRQNIITKEELYRRICIPKEDWQISIHSQSICDIIKPSFIRDLSGGVYDVEEYIKTHKGTRNAFFNSKS